MELRICYTINGKNNFRKYIEDKDCNYYLDKLRECLNYLIELEDNLVIRGYEGCEDYKKISFANKLHIVDYLYQDNNYTLLFKPVGGFLQILKPEEITGIFFYLHDNKMKIDCSEYHHSIIPENTGIHIGVSFDNEDSEKYQDILDKTYQLLEFGKDNFKGEGNEKDKR